MRKIRLLLILGFAVFCGSCGKKDAFDTSGWYFKVKINNQWKSFPDEPGAFLNTEWILNRSPYAALGAESKPNKESILFNFDITIIRYNADSIPIPPKIEYHLSHFEYTQNNKKEIDSHLGLGKISLQEFKVVDTTGKFAGYFKGNMSYVNEEGKTISITEGQFNLPRHDQKVNH